MKPQTETKTIRVPQHTPSFEEVWDREMHLRQTLDKLKQSNILGLPGMITPSKRK